MAQCIVLAELPIASAVCPERLPPLLFENLHVAKNKRPISLHLAKPVGVRVGVSCPEYCSPTFHATHFLLTFPSGWTNLLDGYSMPNLNFLYNIGPWCQGSKLNMFIPKDRMSQKDSMSTTKVLWDGGLRQRGGGGGGGGGGAVGVKENLHLPFYKSGWIVIFNWYKYRIYIFAL